MRRFLQIYQRSLALKLIVFFFVSILVIFLFSDFVIDAIVQNTVLWYKIQIYRWIIIPFILTLFLFKMLRKPFKNYRITQESYESVYKNYRLIVDNLIDDYFFYRHEPGKPFVYLSSSVTNVLGYPKADFIINYKNIGAAAIYEGTFERHQFYLTEKLPSPKLELQVKTNKNNICYLEIKEIAIFNDKGEIAYIEGIAKNITKHKLIELELNEREKKYQTIFESISDGFLVLKDDKFIDCNKRILEIYECTLEELIMHTPFHYRFSPLTQPNGKSSRELAREKIQAALKGIPQQFEWIHLRNGKNPFPAEISLSKFTFENEDYVLAVVRDISTRKTIINTLKEKEESFKLLYDNIPLGIIHLNSELTPVTLNPAAKKILNVAEDSNNTQRFIELLATNFQGNNTIQHHVHIELSLLPYNKTLSLSVYISHFKKDENSIDYLIVFEDITEKKLLLSAYHKQESYFKEILENSRQILYKLNVETGNYEYISFALYHILGYTPDEFYRMSAEEIKSLLHPDDIQKANNIVAKMISNVNENENEFTVEYRFKHKNGTYKWLNDKYQIISSENGIYIVGNIMEITQLKEAEELIKKYRAQFGENM
ncbi:MAG: PAS domain S-box protein [Bacteroidales bacterium]|nr:PAS domain S-box protein [Bacteroidales bacterium]